MITSRDRIKAILDFKTPDRVGLMDVFWDETRTRWSEKLKSTPEDFFDFDIRLLDIERDISEDALKHFFLGQHKNRFLAFSFREPFQRYADRVGLETALEHIGRDPRHVFAVFKKELDKTLTRAISILDRGYSFDGLWLFGDLAHTNGLFFSEEFYRRYLFPFHKEICYFFASYGIPTIMHSDGNISKIIPLLIEAGLRALHPLQATAGLDVKSLKKEYRNEIVFCGNFDLDLLRVPQEKARGIVIERLQAYKEGGGYIFGLDGPVSPDIDLDDYTFIIDLVKEYGKY